MLKLKPGVFRLTCEKCGRTETRTIARGGAPRVFTCCGETLRYVSNTQGRNRIVFRGPRVLNVLRLGNE